MAKSSQITLHLSHSGLLVHSDCPAYGIGKHSTLQIFTYFENPKEYIIKFGHMSLSGLEARALGGTITRVAEGLTKFESFSRTFLY